MAVDAKKIMAKVLKGETNKQRITLYLDKARYNEFKKVAGNASLSQIVDHLILEFIDSAKKTGK